MSRFYINPVNYINISGDNMKLGVIPSFSVTSVATCPLGVPCAVGCYAAVLEHDRPNVKYANKNNWDMLLKNTKDVKNTLIWYINERNVPLFRYNVFGDVEVSEDNPLLYIKLMIEVAKKCPNCSFLVYTKSTVWDEVKSIPKNLHVIESHWKDWKAGMKKNFPTSNILLPDEDRKGKLICPNCLEAEKKKKGEENKVHCETCLKCWKIKPGQCIYFIPHGRNKKKV